MKNDLFIAANVLGIAVCGLVCLLINLDVLFPNKLSAKEDVANQKIAFTTKNALRKGQILKRGDLEELLFPGDDVPSNAMPGDETAYGHAIERDVASGEILLRTDVKNYHDPKTFDVFIR